LGPANIRLLDIAIASLIFMSVIESEKLELPSSIIVITAPLILLGIYSILIFPIQPYPIGNSIIDFIELIEIILFFLILSHNLSRLNKSGIETILRSIFFLTVIGSVAGILYYIATGSRFVGVPFIFGIPSFGIYYGLTYYLYYRNPVTIVFTVIILIRIIFQNSRSLWITLPVPILIIAFLHWKILTEILERDVLIRISALTSAIAGSIIIAVPPITDRFLSLVRGSQFLFARPVVYYSGLQTLVDNPLGIGLGNYATALQDYTVSGELQYPQWFVQIVQKDLIEAMFWRFDDGNMGSHSDIFGFLVETGIIGFSLFVLFWILLLRYIVTSSVSPVQLVLKMSLLYVGLQSIINSQLLTGGGPYIMIILSLLVVRDGM
jgi:O-antigen ligase